MKKVMMKTYQTVKNFMAEGEENLLDIEI